MNNSIEFAQKTALAYSAMCKPICNELQIPQTAFDILMFLANNPDYKSARDIVEVRRIKANLVSVNVDILVREGYLERRDVTGDRRKTGLFCTDKALSVIEKGRKMQSIFFEKLLWGVDEETKESFFSAISIIEKNLDEILKEK